MEFKFEKLIIWQKAMEFGESINKLSWNFPKEEIYNLSSQIRRAVDSIALNISEGSIGQTNPEFKKFIGAKNVSYDEVLDLHIALKKETIWNLLQKKEKKILFSIKSFIFTHGKLSSLIRTFKGLILGFGLSNIIIFNR